MMNEFRFAQPQYAFAMWIVLAVMVLLFWLDGRGRAALDRFLSRAMQDRLVNRLSRTRRWSSLLLLASACVAIVIALMRPQFGVKYVETPRVGAQIMVCLDVSKSMLAEDTAPNRLERAKAELSDLLSYLDGDQVGLIAFAGKATVLCPLTPDFGFFKLILDNTGPHSVGRGGTNLSEPIRKALAGFRTETDVARAIVLITDGEDHDSFPEEAAQAAAERGITIIAIGFGDEAGSPIYFTDDKTGSRKQVTDRDGKPVTTYLDGELLRDIALATEGAYVPAGTGALDLESIYDAHLAPLVRGKISGTGHAIRQEAFQWAILAALVLFICSLAVASGSTRPDTERLTAERPDTERPDTERLTAKPPQPTAVAGRSGKQHAVTLVSGILMPGILMPGILAGTARSIAAQQNPPTAPAAVQPSAAAEIVPEDEDRPPRETYNAAVAALNNDFDQSERLLRAAREAAGTDGELRFRTSYNMGWLEVQRADEQLAEQPAEALTHLQAAANWYRDAIRLRPDHQDSRHNLEVVLRRAMELADSLQHKSEDLAVQLDELIERQRLLVSELRGLVERVQATRDPNATDSMRGQFRSVAVAQRQILSDSQSLAGQAREEFEAIEAKGEDQRLPEEKLRAAQLLNLLHYANRANQRLAQARSQMRLRQAERAFRRAAAGLSELKRQRDQLRSPVEVLGPLIGEAVETARSTATLARQRETVATGPAVAMPAWLTREYIQQSQQSITEQTSELNIRLKAGLEDSSPQTAGPPTPDQMRESSQQQQLIEMIRQAMPFLTTAEDHFKAADSAIEADQPSEAYRQQIDAISALGEARERFMNLKQLVELSFADQSRVQQLLERPADRSSPPAEADEKHIPSSVELQMASSLQEKNLARADRLKARLADEATQASGPAGTGPTPGPVDQQAALSQQQRFEAAQQLLADARQQMQAAQPWMTGAAESQASGEGEQPPSPTSGQTRQVVAARRHVSQAMDRLHELRRLFFSIVEHLRDTAGKQAELNDDTEQIVGTSDPDQLAERTQPVVPRQTELESIARQISEALVQQAAQSTEPPQTPAAQPPASSPPATTPSAAPDPQNMQQAADLVQQGSEQMQQAVSLLTEQTAIEADEVRSAQDQALQKLVEALALLQPPEEEPQNNQNQQQQDQQQNTGDNQDQQQRQQQSADPARLLQAVRDREAQRRRERSNRLGVDNVGVIKDW